jgi:hypothetical protein
LNSGTIIAVLGIAGVAVVGFFLFTESDPQAVDDFEPTVAPAEEIAVAVGEPTATPIALLFQSIDQQFEFCRELGFAEPPCAGAVRRVCREEGAESESCRQARAGYCTAAGPNAGLCR